MNEHEKGTLRRSHRYETKTKTIILASFWEHSHKFRKTKKPDRCCRHFAWRFLSLVTIEENIAKKVGEIINIPKEKTICAMFSGIIERFWVCILYNSITAEYAIARPHAQGWMCDVHLDSLGFPYLTSRDERELDLLLNAFFRGEMNINLIE
jgi:hypothetical protein